MNRRVIEHPRGETDGMAYNGPDHWAPMTWHRCIAEGCTERLDPWLHRMRCDVHQADADAKRERVRAIVAVNTEATRARRRESADA